jgi:hypothetical protein
VKYKINLINVTVDPTLQILLVMFCQVTEVRFSSLNRFHCVNMFLFINKKASSQIINTSKQTCTKSCLVLLITILVFKEAQMFNRPLSLNFNLSSLEHLSSACKVFSLSSYCAS